MKKLLLSVSLFLIGVPAFAQSQDAIIETFLHRPVRLKIDMPGTQLGVDIYPESGDGLPRNYQTLLGQYPVAYRAGDQATVTKIVFKKDHIEFQLDHGGFGQFGDNTDTSPVAFNPAPPSREEEDLRFRIDHEPDGRDRNRNQRFLNDLVRRRLDNDDRNLEAARQATEAKIAFVNDARMRGGSRFNISYDKRIPEGLTVDDVARALDPFLSFDNRSPRQPGYDQRLPTYNPPPPPDNDPPKNYPLPTRYFDIHKGMAFDDVHAATHSRPLRITKKDTEFGHATTEEYGENNNTLVVTYINGVVTQFYRTAR